MVSSVKDSSVKAWEALSLEWSQSGLPQKDFCEQHGVNYKTFVNWRSRNNAATRRTAKRAVKVARKKSPLPLIPLQVIEAETGHPLPNRRPEVKGPAPSPITIVTSSGDRLLITDGFDEKTLLRVLQVLKEAA